MVPATVLHWENGLSPLQVPCEPGKKLLVPCAGTGFGAGCQGAREKLAGNLPRTGEAIRENTWGLAWGTDSLASPDLHIIELAGTALNGFNSGCCALSCPAHRWGKTRLTAPSTAHQLVSSKTRPVHNSEVVAAHISTDMATGSFRATHGARKLFSQTKGQIHISFSPKIPLAWLSSGTLPEQVGRKWRT